jgi:hypothetical protein
MIFIFSFIKANGDLIIWLYVYLGRKGFSLEVGLYLTLKLKIKK